MDRKEMAVLLAILLVALALRLTTFIHESYLSEGSQITLNKWKMNLKRRHSLRMT
jgi:hypothetical protein